MNPRAQDRVDNLREPTMHPAKQLQQSKALVPYRSEAQRVRLEWEKSKHGLKLVRWVYNRFR